MKKKNFDEAVVEVIRFEESDVIATSLSANVTTDAFSGAGGLTTVDLPGVTPIPGSSKDGAFSGAGGLTTVDLIDVTKIGG